MGKVINASVILAGEPERERSLGKPRNRRERKLKLIV
jgi:hypothetical protein